MDLASMVRLGSGLMSVQAAAVTMFLLVFRGCGVVIWLQQQQGSLDSGETRCWEILMVLLVAYCAWVCPFEIVNHWCFLFMCLEFAEMKLPGCDYIILYGTLYCME